MIMYVDNTQAISFCDNLNVNSKMRTTFNIKDRWIQELRDKNELKVEHDNSENNPADILTKPIQIQRFTKLIQIM